ncbi:MAG: OmpA family protein [Succinivibrionaceae bacterium]
MELKIKTIVAVGVIFLTTDAATVTFVSQTPAKELWKNESSKVECSLSQRVKNWGNIEFVVGAGKDKRLELFLSPLRTFSIPTMLNINAESPYWKPGVKDKAIASIALYKNFDGYTRDDRAWNILGHLGKGYATTFIYKDPMYYQNEEIKVYLNPQFFIPAYDKFLECMQNLLPFGYDDIKYSVIHFRNKSENLTEYSKMRLNQITDYLLSSNMDSEISVTVHTDSYGDEKTNKEITDIQANVVKRYFMDKGIKPTKIHIYSYGESDQATVNKTENKRKVNRRVYIEIKNNL